MDEKGIWHQAAEIIGTLRKTTALFPLLVLDVFLVILSAATVPFVSLIIQIIILSFLALSILATIVQCFYFMITDPDRLGTQTQIIQRRALDILADEKHNLGATASHIVAIVNPGNPILPTDKVELPEGGELVPPQPQLPIIGHE